MLTLFPSSSSHTSPSLPLPPSSRNHNIMSPRPRRAPTERERLIRNGAGRRTCRRMLRHGWNSRKTRVTPFRRRRPAREIGQRGQAGSLARLACLPIPPSLSLSLPLVAIVILIRHSNNDSLAANWPTGRRPGKGGRSGRRRRLIVRYGWNGYVPPPPPPQRHRMDELRRRNQSWLWPAGHADGRKASIRPTIGAVEDIFHFQTETTTTTTDAEKHSNDTIGTFLDFGKVSALWLLPSIREEAELRTRTCRGTESLYG